MSKAALSAEGQQCSHPPASKGIQPSLRDAVVHLVGAMTGAAPGDRDVQALLRKYGDLRSALPPLDKALRQNETISYTLWEAWLALYHHKKLLIATAKPKVHAAGAALNRLRIVAPARESPAKPLAGQRGD